MTLPESFSNKNFQERFIGALSGGAEEKEMDVIREVIRLNYTLNPEDRSLKNLQAAFGKLGTYKETGRQSIASRMKKWTNEKDKSIYANFFNSPQDNLDFSSNIVCFDMGDTINNPDLLAPVADYIFHKFNETIASNPSPHIFFVDEMQRYLDSKEFNPSIIRTIKESRKANGIFIGCMQNPSNLIEHEKGGEIIENLATLIIFPNSKARKEHYIDKLNLNDNEFNFVKTCTNPRNVLIKKTGGHSVILDVDLSSLGQHLKLFLSGDKDRAEVQKLINIHQDNWIDEYLKSGAEC